MLHSLLVGLKSIDPAAHDGWDGRNGCWGCELDVDNIEIILSPLGYATTILKTQSALAASILAGLSEAAEKCRAGDTFVFYFSGHGGQQPDTSSDERDGMDETLIAYDREIMDDELNDRWTKFESGVRIFMLSDSCNSGTNYKTMFRDIAESTPIRLFSSAAEDASNGQSTMDAQMIHFGGCRDGSDASGYRDGGAFTRALCQTWDDGKFLGDYPAFHRAIKSSVSSGQVVEYSQYGPVEQAFVASRPFGATRDAGTT